MEQAGWGVRMQIENASEPKHPAAAAASFALVRLVHNADFKES